MKSVTKANCHVVSEVAYNLCRLKQDKEKIAICIRVMVMFFQNDYSVVDDVMSFQRSSASSLFHGEQEASANFQPHVTSPCRSTRGCQVNIAGLVFQQQFRRF
jgi:hypothetical protein